MEDYETPTQARVELFVVMSKFYKGLELTEEEKSVLAFGYVVLKKINENQRNPEIEDMMRDIDYYLKRRKK